MGLYCLLDTSGLGQLSWHQTVSMTMVTMAGELRCQLCCCLRLSKELLTTRATASEITRGPGPEVIKKKLSMKFLNAHKYKNIKKLSFF